MLNIFYIKISIIDIKIKNPSMLVEAKDNCMNEQTVKKFTKIYPCDCPCGSRRIVDRKIKNEIYLWFMTKSN